MYRRMSAHLFDEIAENLNFLDDWEDRYRYLIELGDTLAPINDGERNEINKVRGCASQVWLITDVDRENGENRLSFRGCSDAMIVKGLVAVLISLFSGKTAAEIAATDAISIFDGLGLKEHLTSQRANGLVAMVERIHREAKARL